MTKESSAQQNKLAKQEADNTELEVESIIKERTDRISSNVANASERLNLTPPENDVTTEGVKMSSDISSKDVTPPDKMDMESASPAANIPGAVGVSATDEMCSEVNQNTSSSSKIDQSLKVSREGEGTKLEMRYTGMCGPKDPL